LLLQSEILKYLYPVHLVWNDEYNKAISGAKVALCFFSKLNRDTYTRRCFEIPATGTVLLSEYSDDMATIYQAGKEADYFSSKDELIEKVKLYVENDSLRRQVAEGGNLRVVKDGHDIVSRMSKVITFVGDSD
jgi:spore maturation protein CgeB